MIKEYARLVRVQSIPLTISIISAGFIIESGTLLDIMVIPLIVVGSLGHMGFYAMNEIYDVEWDRKADKSIKPLVNEDISTGNARVLSTALILTSVIIAALTFPTGGFISYVAACILGAVYNSRSKVDTFSSVYMGLWGCSILLTGYLYSGGL